MSLMFSYGQIQIRMEMELLLMAEILQLMAAILNLELIALTQLRLIMLLFMLVEMFFLMELQHKV